MGADALPEPLRGHTRLVHTNHLTSNNAKHPASDLASTAFGRRGRGLKISPSRLVLMLPCERLRYFVRLGRGSVRPNSVMMATRCVSRWAGGGLWPGQRDPLPCPVNVGGDDFYLVVDLNGALQ